MSEQTDPVGNSLGIAIGHLALKRGLITPEQLRDALIEQSKSGKKPLDTILLDKGFLTRTQVELLHSLRETTAFPVEPLTEPDKGPLTKLGKYAVVREAGRGAMARVFEADDTELHRKVALKILNTSPNARGEEAKVDEERFLREARLLAGLPKHPNIVGIYDAGVAQGRRYLVMEYVDGKPMDQWFKQGSVTLGRPTTLLRDVALAVHHAHENGVIHRDLKPANILVDADGRPHVMDFGLAKLAGQSVRASYTAESLAVGTPAYMSPEQAAGDKSLDHRTDVYSMGVMLYEILTGKLPFVGASPMEVMLKTSKDPVVPPSKITGIQINPEHFKTLESICLRALSKSPKDRHGSAAAFADDLTQWLRGRDFRAGRGGAGGRLAMGLVAAGALAGLGFLFYRSRPEPAPVPTPPSAPIAVTAPAPPPADPWKDAIDLLRAVDLPGSIVSGPWNRDGNTVASGDGKPSRLVFPYHPPEEYDVRMTFRRRAANFCVNLILTQDGRPFTLVMHRDGYFGFERIGGKDFNRNTTAARFDTPLSVDRSYTVLVEVRRSGVRSSCDGQPVSVLKSYDGVTMNPDWKLPDPDAIGIGTWDGGVSVERMELREVSGKGSYVRPSAGK